MMTDLPPLAVDLDGTLVLTDTLHESAIKLIRVRPLALFQLPFWLLRGKAYLKERLNALVLPAADLLPYNEPLVDWLREQKASGRELVLCTAASEAMGNAVAAHTGLFDEVIASSADHNMKGANKRAALQERFPDTGFSYAGDTGADLAVWDGAQSAVVVGNSTSFTEKVASRCTVEHTVPTPQRGLKDLLKLLRVHQWAKNTLIFMPAVAAHQISTDNLLTLCVAFLAFSLCSSSVYIANDLLDLENDRRHPRKRERPFASGKLAITGGLLLLPLLLVSSALLSFYTGQAFAWALLTYFVLTSLYSLFLKKIVLLDCLTLAALYTLRIIAGAAALSLGISFWILSFSVFLFLSLAFVKRYVELEETTQEAGTDVLHGRGYRSGDSSIIQGMGIAAGFVAVLVLALYIDSTASAQLYRAPEIVWGAVAVLLYWISWIWLKAHRGEMHDDPVVFAVTDPISLVCGFLFVAVVFLGTTGFSL